MMRTFVNRMGAPLMLVPACLLLAQPALAAPPVNDDCEDRISIFEGDTAFTTLEATTDGPGLPLVCDDTADVPQTAHDIWYKFVAGSSGNLLVTTCDQADYDSDLVFYEGTACPPTVMLACNDDFAGCANFTSQFSVPVVEGGSYLLRVGGWQEGDTGSGTLTLTISNDPEICDNGIDDDLDGLIDCDDPDCVDFIDCLIEICDNGIDDDLDGLIDCDDPDCATFPVCLGCPLSTFGPDDCLLTQSGDPVGENTGTVACGQSGVGTTPNGWARCFDLTAEGATEAMKIDSVYFGTSQATIDDIEVFVNIYIDIDGFAAGPNEPGLDATLLASDSILLGTADEDTFHTVPITNNVVVGPGDYIWVEIQVVADGTEEPFFSYRPAANEGGDCVDWYLRAADCGIASWLATDEIGFVDDSLVLEVACSTACSLQCAPDIDGDCVVGFDDLLDVLAFWGPCVGCPQDFVPEGGDGIVGFDELLAVLSFWGPCI